MAHKRASDEWAVFAVALGARLHRLRTDLGLSQEDVAYAAGLSRYTYQKLERGESTPGTPANPLLQNVMAVAQVLGVPLEEVLPEERPDLRVGRPPGMWA